MPQDQSEEFKEGDYVRIIGNTGFLNKVGKIIEPCPFSLPKCYHIQIIGNKSRNCIGEGYLQKLSEEEAILYAI